MLDSGMFNTLMLLLLLLLMMGVYFFLKRMKHSCGICCCGRCRNEVYSGFIIIKFIKERW